MTDNIIQFNQVSKRYPNGHQALQDISFSLKRGEMAFLTGHSGAGKSTLLKLIALIEQPSNGELVFDGMNLHRLSSRRVPEIRRNIGLIFQNPLLLNERTVLENVSLPLIIAGASYAEVYKKARAALDKVGLLEKEKALPETLSVGEQQRVGIARAIVTKPPLILADEPTGNLDPELSADIMQLFSEFNQVGVSILIASHDIRLINQLHHRRLTLKDGKLISDEEGYLV